MEFYCTRTRSVIAKHTDISDTSEWLKFLHNSIIQAMKNGDTTSEITQYKIPKSIENLKFINSTLQQGLKRQLEKFFRIKIYCKFLKKFINY